jgi:hypothetical protein
MKTLNYGTLNGGSTVFENKVLMEMFTSKRCALHHEAIFLILALDGGELSA